MTPTDRPIKMWTVPLSGRASSPPSPRTPAHPAAGGPSPARPAAGPDTSDGRIGADTPDTPETPEAALIVAELALGAVREAMGLLLRQERYLLAVRAELLRAQQAQQAQRQHCTEASGGC